MKPQAARYAVIGDPVEHSLSPRLFGLLFEQLKLNANYRAERVPTDQLGAFLKRVRAGEFQGLSVTLPHKVTITSLLDGLEQQAVRIGAVNCVRVEGKKLFGHNTDLGGLVRTLHHHLGGHPTRKKVLILGAGGAARAAAVAMGSLSAAEIVIANRTLARAKSVAELVDHGQALPLDNDLRTACAKADVIINATSVGLLSRADPLPETCALRSHQVVLDLVYRPLETALMRRARESGCTVIDGLWVLVYQALFQLALWEGRDVEAVQAEALHAALAPEAR
ncbi:MAG: shikimate dehydrogenase [Deltaproteobacteria bacterium]|nr:shikimate dehydrogenase [Deltaproteobacteria bacterium]